MPHLKIDNQAVEVPTGSTVLEAAARLGITIPTMCHRPGHPANTTCMVCLVKLHGMKGRDRFVPSCGTVAEEGMVVESETPEVLQTRRAALELLLSDHVGDCLGPCHLLCPAHLNIPRMLRQIAAGDDAAALVTTKEAIALPAVLGRICPAPCEKGCRRGRHDAPLAICLLKRYAADTDLALAKPYLPTCQPPTGQRVAIIGAGPAGLGAAFILLQNGHTVEIFDDQDQPGGELRRSIPAERLPRNVLDAEIAVIRQMGALFHPGVRIGPDRPLAQLSREFAAVLVATGFLEPEAIAALDLPRSAAGLELDKKTGRTPVKGLFATAGVLHRNRMAVRALAEGKAAAFSIHQFLSGKPVTGLELEVNSRMGHLLEAELPRMLATAATATRIEPAGGFANGFSRNEAQEEARRCLHCDCRKAFSCKLRKYATHYDAAATGNKNRERLWEQDQHHSRVVYEPGKCIACGICVQITRQAGERYGLAFNGRGFTVRVTVPLSRDLEKALTKSAVECVSACPTGALAFRDGEDSSPV